MAASLNVVAIIGNLTRDPELRSTPGGTSVCSLRVAVNTRRKNSSTGEWEEKPNYFDVTVWGAQGENCARYLSKGRPCGVQGRLEWREWQDKEGNKRQSVEIIAESVQFLGGRDPDGEGGGSGFQAREDAGEFQPAASTQPAQQPGGDAAEDDIPFKWEPLPRWEDAHGTRRR